MRMINFYIINAFGQNLTIQNFALFWDCCKRPKSVVSGNLSKNGCVWAAQWPTSSKLKIKFDPSLDRSWCEFFKIIKNHGPINPPLGCNLGPKYPPPGWSLVRKQNDELSGSDSSDSQPWIWDLTLVYNFMELEGAHGSYEPYGTVRLSFGPL